MLAETRRRSKWSYNPQGKKLASAGVGKGMLEKMGWKDGEGLGSEGKGIVDPITLKYKNDSKGIGFTGNPDAVLAHQDDFEALLQGLSTQHSSSVANSAKNSDEEVDNGDVKEKKNRFRYHKSRRAKDTNNYSSVDIDCIVGKAKDRQKAKKDEDDQQSAEDNPENGEKKESSFITINKGSADDYFKQKMAERMAKLGKPVEPVKLTTADPDDFRPSFGGAGGGSGNVQKTAENGTGNDQVEKEGKEEPSFCKFQTAGTVGDYFAAKMAAIKAKRAAELTGQLQQDDQPGPSEEQTKKRHGPDNMDKEQSGKKDKKSKKRRLEETSSESIEVENDVTEENRPKKSKKSKKDKNKVDAQIECEPVSDKQDKKSQEDKISVDEAEEPLPSDKVTKKSKKSKKKDGSEKAEAAPPMSIKQGEKSAKEQSEDKNSDSNDSKLEESVKEQPSDKVRKKSKKNKKKECPEKVESQMSIVQGEKSKMEQAKGKNSDAKDSKLEESVTEQPSDKVGKKSKKSKKKDNLGKAQDESQMGIEQVKKAKEEQTEGKKSNSEDSKLAEIVSEPSLSKETGEGEIKSKKSKKKRKRDQELEKKEMAASTTQNGEDDSSKKNKVDDCEPNSKKNQQEKKNTDQEQGKESPEARDSDRHYEVNDLGPPKGEDQTKKSKKKRKSKGADICSEPEVTKAETPNAQEKKNIPGSEVQGSACGEAKVSKKKKVKKAKMDSESGNNEKKVSKKSSKNGENDITEKSDQGLENDEVRGSKKPVEEELSGFKGTNLLSLKGYGRW